MQTAGRLQQTRKRAGVREAQAGGSVLAHHSVPADPSPVKSNLDARVGTLHQTPNLISSSFWWAVRPLCCTRSGWAELLHVGHPMNCAVAPPATAHCKPILASAWQVETDGELACPGSNYRADFVTATILSLFTAQRRVAWLTRRTFIPVRWTPRLNTRDMLIWCPRTEQFSISYISHSAEIDHSRQVIPT